MDTMGQQIAYMVGETETVVLQTIVDALKITGREHITVKELEETLENINKRKYSNQS